nr:uncharacterized protein LOC124222140 isoform X2 [Neodiprion pinetum]
MHKSASIENNMEITHHEMQMGHVKIKKDNVTIDTVSQDVESRLTLKTDNLNEERQANGLHQVNGVLDSPKKSSELSSIVSVSQGVASSHKSQRDATLLNIEPKNSFRNHKSKEEPVSNVKGHLPVDSQSNEQCFWAILFRNQIILLNNQSPVSSGCTFSMKFFLVVEVHLTDSTTAYLPLNCPF